MVSKLGVENVLSLVHKAAGAQKSEDAMRFSQAACNAANALLALAAYAEPVSKQ